MNQLEEAIRSSHKIRKATKDQYAAHVGRFVTFARGHWSGASVEAWRDFLKTHDGLSNSSINAMVSAVKTASRRQFQLGLGPDFAAGAELLPKARNKTRTAPEITTVEKIVEACEGTKPQDLRDRAMILLMARTGMRIGGIRSITFERIQKSTIWIRLKGHDEADHKIELQSEEAGALYAWTAWLRRKDPRISGAVFRGVSMDLETDYVIGPPLSPAGAYQAIKRRARKAGVPKIHPHLFRNFYISYQRSVGTPDWRIAEVTGHQILEGGTVPMLGTYTSDLEAKADPIGAKIPPLRRK